MSDKDKADDILRQLRAAMSSGAPCSPFIYWLAREKRTVQRRVLDALRGPRKVGAPKRPLSDEEWLDSVECWRESMKEMNDPSQPRPSDLAVIRDWLLCTDTRFERKEGKPFRPATPSGKAEVRRIRDAIVRARRNRKKAMRKA